MVKLHKSNDTKTNIYIAFVQPEETYKSIKTQNDR